MNTYKLIITCTKTVKAFGLKMKLNGMDIDVPKEQNPITIDITDNRYTLYVYFADNKYRVHNVEKSIVIQPQNCSQDTILCELSLKVNIIGAASIGLLAPQYDIISKISYL